MSPALVVSESPTLVVVSAGDHVETGRAEAAEAAEASARAAADTAEASARAAADTATLTTATLRAHSYSLMFGA